MLVTVLHLWSNCLGFTKESILDSELFSTSSSLLFWYFIFFLQVFCILTCQLALFRLFVCTEGSGLKNTRIPVLLWLVRALVQCTFHGKLYANSRLKSILILAAMLLHIHLLGFLGAKLFATLIIQLSVQTWFLVFFNLTLCTTMMP